MNETRRKVLILYTDAGGGHRATARALQATFEKAGYSATCHNPYLSTLQPLDMFRRLSGRSVEETYNEAILARGRTGIACWAFYAGAAANVRLLTPMGRRAFRHLWRETRPDLVISVMPVINGMIADTLWQDHAGRVPFVVVMTDWAELMRHVWFPPGHRFVGVTGSAEGAASLARKSHPKERTIILPTLLTHPDFAQPLPEDRDALRQDLGLEPGQATALVSFGGVGASRMMNLANAMAKRPLNGQVVFICGRNEPLRADLAARSLPYPHRIVGYTDRMRDYLVAADVFVGKPGPQSVSEARATGLPMLLLAADVLPQEASVLRSAVAQGDARPVTTESTLLDELQAALAAPPDMKTRVSRRRFTDIGSVVADLARLVPSAP